MTLNNKNWLKKEVSRLYLSGYSQENIAKEVNISIGMVNALVNEIIESDDTADLQRQIAIVSKKTGVDIKQIAANLRWKNKIKQSSLDDRKIERFIDGMDILFNKYNIAPSTAEKLFFSLIETMLKKNLEPHRLEEEIKLKLTELETITAQIQANDKLLEESNAKLDKEQESLKIRQKDLDQFREVRLYLDLYGHSELSGEFAALARAMVDFKNLKFDPNDIVSKYENMISLSSANEKLDAKLQRSEKVFEAYKRKQEEEEARWKEYYNAFQIFMSLVKDGLKPEDIFNVVHIIKKDFPQNSITQLVEGIRTYGSISAATWRLERQYEAETEPML
jgi:transcriptional regulator with XRE-family HTH domain